MLSTSPIAVGRNRILGSVFSRASDDSSSPAAWALGLESLGQSSRSADPHLCRSLNRPSDASTIDDSLIDQEKWDEAWNIVTTFLSLPDPGFEAIIALGRADEVEFLKKWGCQDSTPDNVQEALAYLVAPLSHHGWLRPDKGTPNILNWYEFEMRRHFLKNFRDGLLEV